MYHAHVISKIYIAHICVLHADERGPQTQQCLSVHCRQGRKCMCLIVMSDYYFFGLFKMPYAASVFLFEAQAHSHQTTQFTRLVVLLLCITDGQWYCALCVQTTDQPYNYLQQLSCTSSNTHTYVQPSTPTCTVHSFHSLTS